MLGLKLKHEPFKAWCQEMLVSAHGKDPDTTFLAAFQRRGIAYPELLPERWPIRVMSNATGKVSGTIGFFMQRSQVARYPAL
mmetsp:Transcript_102410/g.320048  ORF Transcript_102410/g.320048 Transcript_102410/m.320048 type:complete len:82 (-) Transcript_102410:70-315(-)